MSRSLISTTLLSLALLLAIPRPLTADSSATNPLDAELGRSETRVRSAPIPLAPGRTVWQTALEERLERRGYGRVKQRPEKPGEYFWGREIFWIYRPAHRSGGDDHKARLFGLTLASDGRIRGGVDADGEPLDADELYLEPVLLAESLDGKRAVRRPLDFDRLPEHVWRAVLAAEDSRFFDHWGVDARSLARALLANIKAGGVAQGGSTITQQLIKNRDLTPKRTLRRKVSEAVRALTLEAEYDKEDILETYLGHVYLGHVDGLAIHGFATAARIYFSKKAEDLNLAEAALLAGMIQGPNSYAPDRHAERAKTRRDWVLGRLEELGWASATDVAAAKRQAIRLHLAAPEAPPASHFLGWIREVAQDEAEGRLEDGRGVVVETGLDPQLQDWAEEVVRGGLASLRRDHRSLRSASLGVALVSLDTRTGDVLAYVGGDPDAPAGGFDRARQARRQPGSTVKPLVLLEALDNCGRREPLHAAARVLDAPLRVELDTSPGDPPRFWEPRNDDGRFHGNVDIRQALVDSLNIPFVRIARWCGFERVAGRLRDAGLDLPDDPPPSFVLGAVETSPLRLAQAYTALAQGGRAMRPRPVRRLEKPGGGKIEGFRPDAEGVASDETTWIVRDLLLDAARRGTARAASIDGLEVAAKTGTSSGRRDAWLAGWAGSVVTVVWVGRDDDRPLGLTGSQAAAPLWKRFMEKAVPARPDFAPRRPARILELYIDTTTGLLVRARNPDARLELFRRGALPRRDRFWRIDEPVPALR